MKPKLAVCAAAFLLMVGIGALHLVLSHAPGRASGFGEITWTISVEPAAPQVGDEIVVAFNSCCYGGSPLMGAKIRIVQPEPPVVRQVGVSSSYYGVAATLEALSAGTVTLQASGAFEKWVCPEPATPTPTPLPVPPGCGSTLHYTGSSVEITVSGEPPAWFGDANCDDDVDSRDAAIILQVIAGLLTPTGCFNRADVNGDCRYDARDALLILQTTAGFLAERPYETVLCQAPPQP